jgi:glyoxylase-like metal-dependent hydrolase (beta-lactamase superfamily II)
MGHGVQNMNRLGVVCGIVCVLASALPSLLAQDKAPNNFARIQVADGVYAFIYSRTSSGIVNGNCTVILGDDGVLVVDSGQFPLAARRIIAEIRQLTDKPVRVLVNTHWHADHVLSNNEYRRAFPGVTVLAHDETRRLMEKNKERVLQLPTQGPAFAQSLREALQRGTRRDGTPFPAEQRASLENQSRDLEAILPELPLVEFAPADTTFTGAVTIRLGRREVRLLHLGRGNTAGDVIVAVPDARVVATGDLVVAPVPFGFGCYPAEWLVVLDTLLALADATVFIPGHGPVMHDTAYIRTVRDVLKSLRAQVHAAVKDGLSLEETRKRVDFSTFRAALTGDDPLLWQAFQSFFVDSAVERAYKEAKGETLVE